MEKLLKEICAACEKRGGGGVGNLTPENVAGIALLMKDGRVALLNLEAAR